MSAASFPPPLLHHPPAFPYPLASYLCSTATSQPPSLSLQLNSSHAVPSGQPAFEPEFEFPFAHYVPSPPGATPATPLPYLPAGEPSLSLQQLRQPYPSLLQHLHSTTGAMTPSPTLASGAYSLPDLAASGGSDLSFAGAQQSTSTVQQVNVISSPTLSNTSASNTAITANNNSKKKKKSQPSASRACASTASDPKLAVNSSSSASTPAAGAARVRPSKSKSRSKSHAQNGGGGAKSSAPATASQSRKTLANAAGAGAAGASAAAAGDMSASGHAAAPPAAAAETRATLAGVAPVAKCEAPMCPEADSKPAAFASDAKPTVGSSSSSEQKSAKRSSTLPTCLCASIHLQ